MGRSKKILVIGGARSTSSNLVRAVQEHDVRYACVQDRVSTGTGQHIEGFEVEPFEEGLFHQHMIVAATGDCHADVRLAAGAPVLRSNQGMLGGPNEDVTGSSKVVETPRAVDAHVAVASSSSAYGASSCPWSLRIIEELSDGLLKLPRFIAQKLPTAQLASVK